MGYRVVWSEMRTLRTNGGRKLEAIEPEDDLKRTDYKNQLMTKVFVEEKREQ